MEQALASLPDVAEVLIFDNSSGADWSVFTTFHGFHVYTLTEPITDFAAIRNQALSMAEHDWVLFIDSDEVITPESFTALTTFCENPHGQAASVVRSDVFYGKKLQYGEAGNQPLVRLCNKHFCAFTGAVHERAVVKGSIVQSGITLEHYSHTSISEFIATVSVYAQLLGRQKKASKKQLVFEMLTFPLGKLYYGLVIQGGFLDGWRGIVYAACMSLHSLLVRVYAYEAHYL